MRIWFFGSGAFGLPTLTRLANEHEVVGVVTQPDRPAGRGRKLTPNPVAAWAAEHLPGSTIIKSQHLSREAPVELTRCDADAWVVIAFGQKLSRALLADRFAINLHASLLPRWRGAAPINAAILAGDALTGNSVIALADRMDAGVVYAQSRRAIEPCQTAGELHDLLAGDGPELVERVLAEHQAGTLEGVAQEETQATLAPKLSRSMARVDLSDDAAVVARTINGLSPWPGVSVEIAGQRVKLVRAVAQELTGGPHHSGTLVDPETGVIACGVGEGGRGGDRVGRRGVRLIELTPAGKRTMTWAEYQRGSQLVAGERIGPCPAGSP